MGKNFFGRSSIGIQICQFGCQIGARGDMELTFSVARTEITESESGIGLRGRKSRGHCRCRLDPQTGRGKRKFESRIPIASFELLQGQVGHEFRARKSLDCRGVRSDLERSPGQGKIRTLVACQIRSDAATIEGYSGAEFVAD